MNALYSLFAVFALIVIAMLGAGAAGLEQLFGLYIPWLAIAVFLLGFVTKVIGWAKSPVPFRIPTTAGQMKSLPWIEHDKYDNPQTTGQNIVRMALEVLLFRSLFRNLAVQRFGSTEDGVDMKVRYASAKWLWLFALIFHYSFLVVFIRHWRLFMDPVPGFLTGVEFFDGLLQIGVPTLYLTDATLVLGATLLLLRRFVLPQVRYISQPADYFPLFLILAIALSGIIMRYWAKTDVMNVKEVTMALFSMNPAVHPHRHRHHLLRPPLPGQLPAGLLPHEQTDAHGRRVPVSDQEPAQQQPREIPSQPVERPRGQMPLLCGLRGRVP